MAAAVGNPSVGAQEPKEGSRPENRGVHTDSQLRKPRTKRPNFNEIHAKPLPLEVLPLPAFIPHNPLSIVRIAISLIKHSFRRPLSHTVTHKAYFSAETQSIHVTDPKTIRALWEQGFWGAGSLSRSDPRWLDQEKGRRGIDAASTSEEFTRRRREERRQMKLERAKIQRETIEQQLREEGKLVADVHTQPLSDLLDPADEPDPLGNATGTENPAIEEVGKVITKEVTNPDIEIKNQEHLQLTFEEAFFLSYVLGVLEVHQDNVPVDPPGLLRLFCKHSEFRPTDMLPSGGCIAPDDPFLLNYVVFHHFRSLGWVVRPGIKFACDYLLYLRGPAFHHAEFAIMIIPSYSHSYWSTTPELTSHAKKKADKDWWWLHRLNRVQSQAHKTLLLVYVEVPPPFDVNSNGRDVLDIGEALEGYQVREFIWKRWSPNRNRD
jgi:tRNA-splicing endonuclease subunit Sen2